MTLGERINRLRADRGLSQEDLAELLQVSRQSVSKWETDTSVPDLGRLLKLSEVFGVTLDELVKGPSDTAPDPETIPPFDPAAPGQETTSAAPPERKTPPTSISGTQKIVGIVLLCFAVLVALVLLFMSGSLFSFILALPFLLCGILCLTAKRRAGLWCGWVWFASLMLYFRYATGIRWTLTLQTLVFQPEWNYMRLIVSWVMLLAMVLMVFRTARSFRTVTFAPTRRNGALLAIGWGLWLLIPRVLNKLVFFSWLSQICASGNPLGSSYTVYSLLVTAENCLRFLTLNVLVVCSLALLRGYRRQKRSAAL